MVNIYKLKLNHLKDLEKQGRKVMLDQVKKSISDSLNEMSNDSLVNIDNKDLMDIVENINPYLYIEPTNTKKDVSVASLRLEIKKLNKAIERKNKKISYYKNKIRNIERLLENKIKSKDIKNLLEDIMSEDIKIYQTEEERVERHNKQKRLDSVVEYFNLFTKETGLDVISLIQEIDNWLENCRLLDLDYEDKLKAFKNFSRSEVYADLVSYNR